MNGCAPSLALIERLQATRKWAFLPPPPPGFCTALLDFPLSLPEQDSYKQVKTDSAQSSSNNC